MKFRYNKNIFKTLTSVFLISFLFSANIFGQTKTNIEKLLEFARQKKIESQTKKQEAIALANEKGFTIKKEDENGKIIELMSIRRGIPQYYETTNIGAAATTRADKLWIAPYNITGTGYDKLGEWDGGAVRATHQELTGRVTQVDGATSISDHSTHVAGTLIASGVDANAKGMANTGSLKAWEWTDDESEMAIAAAGGLEISNHSYGFIRGWYFATPGPKGIANYWYGEKDISTVEDISFGFYDVNTVSLDQIAYDAPNYLILKSAGNDRGEAGSQYNRPNYWFDATADDWVVIPSGTVPGKDGGIDGYDCIGEKGVAKNILTVGAVSEILNYTGPNDVIMSSFSGWGPADDGRIKPDVVAKGVSVYSSVGSSNTAYGTYSGTSMATPNTAGTLALLQQYYQQTHNAEVMRSATLKALVIHSADEAGSNNGPDYKFGWGLVNAERAAQLIENDISTNNSIDELVLSNGGSYTREVTVDGSEPLVVTIVWTDVPGVPVAYSLDPSNPMLVHDLDLKITKGGNTYYPWKLDRNNPAVAATKNSQNHVDNVEKVEIVSPVAGTYLVEVNHTGTLSSSQAFSIIISGDTTPMGILADIKIMLEGTYDGVSNLMNTSINSNIPLQSPYAEDSRTVTSIPADVVDWVLVELREIENGPVIVSKSAFVRNDGKIVGDDGSSNLSLNVSAGEYYIVVKHRNHLGIMSSQKVNIQ
ncbi:MAG: S8 family serine peptidase [Melioribacteraceae bacterium]